MIRTLIFFSKVMWRVAITRAKKRPMDRTPVHCHSTLNVTCSPLAHIMDSVVGVDRETGRPLILVSCNMKLETADRRGNKRSWPQKIKINVGKEKIKRRVKKSAVSRRCSLVRSASFNDFTRPFGSLIETDVVPTNSRVASLVFGAHLEAYCSY